MGDLTVVPSPGAVQGWRFRLLWAGQTISVLGDGAATLALPLLILQITDNPLAAAAVAAARTLAYLTVGLWIGPVVDRIDVRRTMIGADCVRGLLFLLLVGAVRLPGAELLIIATAVLVAVAGIFFESGLAIAVVDLVERDELTTANARLELSNQLGLLLGPSLIGALIAVVGLNRCLVGDAATFAVSVITLIPLRFSRRTLSAGDTAGRSRLRADLTDGLRFIRGHMLLKRLVGLQTVVNFVIAAETLVVYFARQNLHAGPRPIGIVVAASGAGGILAATAAGRVARRLSSQHAIGWGIMLLGVALLGMGFSHAAWQLALANLLLSGLAVQATIHIRALRQLVTPHELLGRVTATARTLALAANPLGATLFAAITASADHDARWSFLIAALLSVASAGAAYGGLIRRAPGGPP